MNYVINIALFVGAYYNVATAMPIKKEVKQFIATSNHSKKMTKTVNPVNLLSFYAQRVNTNVKIVWEATAEESNLIYLIEKMVAGTDEFKQIGLAKSKSTSKEQRVTYEYPLHQSNSKKCYYRLKIVTEDGQVTYSKTIEVRPLILDNFQSGIYPNPVVNKGLDIVINSTSEKVTIQILSLRGKVLHQQKRMVKGKTTITIDAVKNLEPGYYYIRIITSKGSIANHRLLKQ